MRISAAFEWAEVGHVTLDHGGRLFFGSIPPRPGIYRFRLSGADGTAVYIGETDDLRRRLTHYRNPGPTQRTNIRLNERLKSLIGTGGRVDLATVTDASVEIDGRVLPAELSGKIHRRLLESAALAAAAAEGVDHLENL